MVSAQALAPDLRSTSAKDLAALLCSACPGIEVVDIAAQDWTADRYAGASWMTGRSGCHAPLREALDAMRGPLRVVGGDVAGNWAGWMEGAIVSAAEGVRWACAPGNP
jgi:monoamine oxidase